MITLMFIIACIGFTIAGDGGFVYLINLSGSDWKRTYENSSIMQKWEFPTLVKNGDAKLVYIEFPYLFVPQARVDYELVETGGKSFQINAYGRPVYIGRFILEVIYTNLEIDGQPKGLRRSLGWRNNGDTNIIIIGRNGKYTGTGLDGSNWMKNNIDALGSKSLKEISIPGSHNAGMSRLDGHTEFGKPCNVLTQTFAFGDQLRFGMRYFDVRPVIGNRGKFLTGHYTHIPGSWQGGNGQSISSIVTDLNAFTKDHNELILIKLSHSLNTDVGSNSYRKFNQEEWEQLFQQLDKINFFYINDSSNVHLDEITLADYTNHGTRASVVIVVDDPDSKVHLGSRLGKGFFMPSNLYIYDDYTDTSDWMTMIDSQTHKMIDLSNTEFFLLSWTLTQSGTQAALCPLLPSVKELAYEANIQLGMLLYGVVFSFNYPNIILVDDVRDTDVASMALAISYKIMRY